MMRTGVPFLHRGRGCGRELRRSVEHLVQKSSSSSLLSVPTKLIDDSQNHFHPHWVASSMRVPTRFQQPQRSVQIRRPSCCIITKLPFPFRSYFSSGCRSKQNSPPPPPTPIESSFFDFLEKDKSQIILEENKNSRKEKEKKTEPQSRRRRKKKKVKPTKKTSPPPPPTPIESSFFDFLEEDKSQRMLEENKNSKKEKEKKAEPQSRRRRKKKKVKPTKKTASSQKIKEKIKLKNNKLRKPNNAKEKRTKVKKLRSKTETMHKLLNRNQVEGILRAELQLTPTELKCLLTRYPKLEQINCSHLNSTMDFLKKALGYVSDSEFRELFRSKWIGLVHIQNDAVKRSASQSPLKQYEGEGGIIDRVKYLENVVGYGKVGIRAILRSFPAILSLPISSNLKPKFMFLTKVAFQGKVEALADLILACPQIVQLSLPQHIKPRVEAVLERGGDPSASIEYYLHATDEDFLKWLSRLEPKPLKGDDNDKNNNNKNIVADLDLVASKSRLKPVDVEEILFSEVGMPPSTTRDLIQRNNGILSMKKAEFLETIQYVRRVFHVPLVDLRDIVDSPLGQVLHMHGEESLLNRIQFLEKIFSHHPGALALLLRSFPAILTLKLEADLKPKIAYLKDNVFGGDVKSLTVQLLSFPQLLSYSLDDVIRPRVEAVKNTQRDPAPVLAYCVRVERAVFEEWLSKEESGSRTRKGTLELKKWENAYQAVAGLSFAHSLTTVPTEHSKTELKLTLSSEPKFVDSCDGLKELSTILFEQSINDIVAIDSEFAVQRQQIYESSILQIAYRPDNKDDPTDVKCAIVDILVQDKDYVRLLRILLKRMVADKLVLGFSMESDILMLESKLRISLNRNNMLDLQNLWSHSISLQDCVNYYCSVDSTTFIKSSPGSWHQRPLSLSQVQYAAMDAAVLLVVLAEKAREENIPAVKTLVDAKQDKRKKKKETIIARDEKLLVTQTALADSKKDETKKENIWWTN